MSSKQFVIRFVFAILLLLLLVGLFNRIVDPFWLYRDIEIKGFNKIKPKFQNFERQIKPDLLTRDQPEAIILGSSFSEIGFDPTNMFFTNHGRLKSMNFAFSGLNATQCSFEFAVTHANIKRALIGFHPGNMPIDDCEKKSSSFGPMNPIGLWLSSAAFNNSVLTVLNQKEQAATHTREGMYFYDRENRINTPARFSHDLQVQAASCNAIQRLNKKIELDLGGLQRMIRTANKYGVELVLFAYPSHAYSLELNKQCGELDERWQAMKQIASMLEAESIGGRAWQFYSYNNTTAEPVGTTTKYWQDPGHFNFEMGNMILKDIFSGGLPGLGRPLVSRNIEADYQYYLQERAEYIQHHPEFQADLQKLLQTK